MRLIGKGRLPRRRSSLLAFATLAGLYALSMILSDRSVTNTTLDWFGGIIPLTAWAVVWWAASVLCLAGAFRPGDVYGFGAIWALMAFWSIMSFVGWVMADVTIGSVAVWLVLAWLVWTIAGWPEDDRAGEDEP